MLCLFLLRMKESHHSLRVVTQRTGLDHACGAGLGKALWRGEAQTHGDQPPVYSDAEIERLTLLRLATGAGHSIGSIANLPLERLKTLVAEAEPDGFDGARCGQIRFAAGKFSGILPVRRPADGRAPVRGGAATRAHRTRPSRTLAARDCAAGARPSGNCGGQAN